MAAYALDTYYANTGNLVTATGVRTPTSPSRTASITRPLPGIVIRRWNGTTWITQYSPRI